jgi:hypothetical protein
VTWTCDWSQATAATLHVSTAVSKHPPIWSQLQNVPKLQHWSLGVP